MAHGIGMGKNDALGKACAEELRQTLGALIDKWEIGGIDTIVCISSAWAFDFYLGVLIRELCQTAQIKFNWTAVEYGLNVKNERKLSFAAQGASIASCLIALCDSKKSPIKQMTN